MPRTLLSEDVLDATFTQTQFRTGYDEREVDDFLDRATAALRHHEKGLPAADAPLSSQDVSGARFTQTQLRRGYDQQEVDTFLEDLAGTLRQHEAGGGAPAVTGSSTPNIPTPAPRGHPVSGGILHEDELWGSRLLRRLRGDKG